MVLMSEVENIMHSTDLFTGIMCALGVFIGIAACLGVIYGYRQRLLKKHGITPKKIVVVFKTAFLFSNAGRAGAAKPLLRSRSGDRPKSGTCRSARPSPACRGLLTASEPR